MLRFAEQMAWTNPTGYVDDDLYAELRRHFDDVEVLELGMTAAALVGMGKLILVMDYAEREDSCPIHPPS